MGVLVWCPLEEQSYCRVHMGCVFRNAQDACPHVNIDLTLEAAA